MRRFTIILTILVLIPIWAGAQNTDPAAILAYYEDDTQLEVMNTANQPIPVYFGMELRAGDTVRTNRTIAELQLEPNGSIVKLSENTVFTVDELQSSPRSSNRFSLAAGKIRAIAASAGMGNRYQIATPSAVCGVRGTDFGIWAVPGSSEQAFVNQGVVEFVKNATGESLTLSEGMAADALAAAFEAIRLSQEQIQSLLQDMQFQELDPATVPGHEIVAADDGEDDIDGEEEPGDQTSEGEETTEGGTTDEGTGEASTAGATTGATTGASTSGDTTGEAGGGRDEGRESALARALGEIVGFEIGTITISGDTWSKAVIMPRFEVGKLKVGLYLPFVYKDDVFDHDQWYAPEGNDEWSFGTDYDWQAEPWEALQDTLTDLSLKIRYLEWGEQRDPFFLKLGNLHNMTVGHGTIMKNFANDLDFPAVRRVGVNLGIDGKKSGFEGVVNDVAKPEIFGGRIYFRPIGKFAIGFTSIVDIDPLSKANTDATDPDTEDIRALDSMSFYALGADMELPIVENDVLSIIPFADATVMVPERNGNLEFDIVYNSEADSFLESFRNYGLTAGFFGNLLFVDYNLEFRYYDGIFRPTFFGTTYERIRGTLVRNTLDYLTFLEESDGSGSNDYDQTVMGIFGGAHTVLLDLVDIQAGYMWPWRSFEELSDPTSFNDEFTLSVYLLPKVAKVTKVYGGVEYSRTNFIPAFKSDELSLFDAYTSVKGELVYPVAPSLDIAAVISTAVEQYEDGTYKYDSHGNPEIVPNITIETRVHF